MIQICFFLSFHYFFRLYLYLCVREVRLHRISSINLFTKAILLFGELKISTAHNAYIQIHLSMFGFTQENAFIAHVQFSEFYMLFHYLELQSAIFNFCNSFSEFDCVVSLSPYIHILRAISFDLIHKIWHQDWFYLFIIRQKNQRCHFRLIAWYNVDVKKII